MFGLPLYVTMDSAGYHRPLCAPSPKTSHTKSPRGCPFHRPPGAARPAGHEKSAAMGSSRRVRTERRSAVRRGAAHAGRVGECQLQLAIPRPATPRHASPRPTTPVQRGSTAEDGAADVGAAHTRRAATERPRAKCVGAARDHDDGAATSASTATDDKTRPTFRARRSR